MIFTETQINSFFPSVKKLKKSRSKDVEKNRKNAASYRRRTSEHIADFERKISHLQPDFVFDRPFLKKRSAPKFIGMESKERNKIHAAAHRTRVKEYIAFLNQTLSTLECRA